MAPNGRFRSTHDGSSVRQRIRQWAARLLVPMHENGRIQGFIALGVRDDGQTYDDEGS